MHKNWIRLLSATLLLFFAFSAACDKEHPDGAGKHPAMGTAAQSDSSRMQCKASSESLDRLLTVFAEARKSGDKAEMKAALEQAEAHIAGMKTEMARCMNHMGMNHMGMKCGMKADKAGAGAAPVPDSPHQH